jgi:hypothetical protein
MPQMDVTDQPIESANHVAITQVAIVMVLVFVNWAGAEMTVVFDTECIHQAHVMHIPTQTCTVPVYATLIGVDIIVQYTPDTVTQFVTAVMEAPTKIVRPVSKTLPSIAQVLVNARKTGVVMDVKHFQEHATISVTDVVDLQSTTATTALKMLNGTTEDVVVALTTGVVHTVRHTWVCVTRSATPVMVQPLATVAHV